MTELKQITVLGTGVLGSQIAYQTAYHGFDVVAYDINAEVIEKAKARFDSLAAAYKAENVEGAKEGKADEALQRITYSYDLGEAVAKADLVIEAIPEDIAIKRDTYEKLATVAPEHTVFATNSSTLLPSDLKEFTGRPEKFLALHFANHVWVNNTAEVMGTESHRPRRVPRGRRVREEHRHGADRTQEGEGGLRTQLAPGPLLNAASDLLIDGIADPDMVDKTWRIGTGAPFGPFQIMDVVGLTTVYNISSQGGEKQREFADYIKKNYIDEGKLGVAVGDGFYNYKG